MDLFIIILKKFSPEFMFTDLREEGGGGERERERRNIDVREKH